LFNMENILKENKFDNLLLIKNLNK
jgi:hypothetical protein